MRVLVTGSRTWRDVALLFSVLDHWHATCGIDVIIEGCARGADQIAEQWAHAEIGIENDHYPADWDAHGNSAGPIRNSRMLVGSKPDLVIAFHVPHPGGCGTEDMVQKAEKAGVRVVRVPDPIAPQPTNPVGY